jgi:hypothetical protein
VASRSTNVARSSRRRRLRADNVFERNGLAGQFGIDRSTQEAIAKVHPHFGQVARVIADGDVLSDIRSKGNVDVPKAVKMNAPG